MEERQPFQYVMLLQLGSHRPKMGFPDIQLVKNLPALQETLVVFLGREDPLEKG